ncbi:uncharacterized protein LOC113520021 [Galleria mellonella]|uniref:Uncharacterized protein LOC113520021 n=1 Tax=Galleria mellonella TaxID=7137 RepID=A0A6J1X4T6_GALME|nr:uncharacterized protein LOC113520021 [Galleria mellonella]
MPLKRTPPPSPAPHTGITQLELNVSTTVAPDRPSCDAGIALRLPHSEQLHGSSSEPNLNEMKTTNATRKRKHSLYDDEMLNSFITEMRQMFKDFRDEQDRRNERLCAVVEDLRISVDFLAHKYDLLKSKMDKLETDHNADMRYVKTLEDKIETLERNNRSTCLEIRNIPTSPTETKNSLLETFIKTSGVLSIPVQPSEIKDIFRIKTKQQASKTIIVDLTSSILKEKNIAMYRKYNKGSSKLTTETLHLSGPVSPIYISENLSSKMKKLFYLAREFAKTNDYKYCWVSHGKIFLRKSDNGSLIPVTDDTVLEKINISK